MAYPDSSRHEQPPLTPEELVLANLERTLGPDDFQEMLLDSLRRNIANYGMSPEVRDQLLALTEIVTNANDHAIAAEAAASPEPLEQGTGTTLGMTAWKAALPEATQARSIVTEASSERQESERIKEIVDSVVASGIYGKFTSGTRMATGSHPEVLIERRDYDDYGIYPVSGNSKLLKSKSMVGLAGRLGDRLRGGSFTDYNRYLKNHTLAFIPATLKDEPYTLIDYVFLSDYVDATGRPAAAQVLSIVPKEKAEALKEIIKKNPDALDEFFQQVAKGLERAPGTTNTTPGVVRRRAEALDIIDIPDEAFSTILEAPDAATFNRAIRPITTTLRFSQPRGTYEF